MAPLPRFNEIAPQPLPQYGPLPYLGQGQGLSLIGTLTKQYDIKLNAAQPSLNLANILQNGTVLRVAYSVRDTSAGLSHGLLQAQFNGDAAADYNNESNSVIAGANNPFESLLVTAMNVGLTAQGGVAASSFAEGWFELYNYADTTMQKMMTGKASGRADTQRMSDWGGTWILTQAITSVLLFPNSGSLASGSRFTLWVYG